MTDGQQKLRCAIYTRKSTEHGLEQEFNSLDAQREACEAYIKSQHDQGWRSVEETFDDGGFSGGTSNRPGLSRIMDAVRAGRVDVVMVYKVDRLTRSLSDFAKIVDLFDHHCVSFVSVTQQFNTTTSMGRLTLNVLLSFAQFEREITSERIRDKIQASKEKGMWMGGSPPFGYDNQDRELVVNQADAKCVRHIFGRYIELKSMIALQCELTDKKIFTRKRIGRSGKAYGGKPFSRGALYTLIQNELYIGNVLFKGISYKGKQEAIVPAELWNAAQAVLGKNRRQRSHRKNNGSGGLLSGLLVGSDCSAFSSVFTSKGSRRYRYYVSKGLRSRSDDRPFRVSASALEKIIQDEVARRFRDKEFVLALTAKLHAPDLVASQLIENAGVLSETVVTGDGPALRELIDQIVLDRRSLRIRLKAEVVLRYLLGEERSDPGIESHIDIEVTRELRLKRSGSGNSIVIMKPPGEDRSLPDKHLIKAIARAHLCRDKLLSGEFASLAEIAKSEAVDRRYLSRVLHLAFLSPRIVDAICNGSEPEDLTTEALLKAKDFPMDWREQEKIWGIVAS